MKKKKNNKIRADYTDYLESVYSSLYLFCFFCKLINDIKNEKFTIKIYFGFSNWFQSVKRKSILVIFRLLNELEILDAKLKANLYNIMEKV